VTEIFIRVNSEGVPLSQADFAMSKIAVNETYGGNLLRKAIDYFCHMAIVPDFYRTAQADQSFAPSEYFQSMGWLRNENDDLYDPSYGDLLRVAFTTEFKRGKLQDLVALLSGRNFETQQYEETIVEESFTCLKRGVLRFMNETHFKRFLMILRSCGFVDSSLIGSQNAMNFAYILYLTLRDQKIPDAEIEKLVRRWYAFSILTGRYSSSPETTFDYDIRQIHSQGASSFLTTLIRGELSDAFWDISLPQEMETSSGISPYFRVFKAAQVKMNDHGFLSRDITVRELIQLKGDEHHIFPRGFLKKNSLSKGQYNQIANFAVAQSEINIAIGDKEPKIYFVQLLEQCSGGKQKYGSISDSEGLRENLRMHCIPDGIKDMGIDEYPEFLARRRQLMAKKIKVWFEGL
jgi:hypothetical protein